MSSNRRLEVRGKAPFSKSGVYEVRISISDSKPSDDAIRRNKFARAWSGAFHLRVNNGTFVETLGSGDNPLPDSLEGLGMVWIIVTDIFTSAYSVFDVPLGGAVEEEDAKTEAAADGRAPKGDGGPAYDSGSSTPPPPGPPAGLAADAPPATYSSEPGQPHSCLLYTSDAADE